MPSQNLHANVTDDAVDEDCPELLRYAPAAGDVERDAAMLGCSRGGLPFGTAWLDVTAQDDACRWIYQMGLFARCADDRLVCVGIHDYIVGGKALNAKARVRAAVDEWRHD